MRLIESYLSEVGRHLPKKQRSDILNELRVSLEEQVLDAAGETPPDLDDEKKVINGLGHPLQVASGFQEAPSQRAIFSIFCPPMQVFCQGHFPVL